MKKVTILSKQEAKKLSFILNSECIIISINTDGIKNCFADNKNIKDIIFLTFDDVEFNDEKGIAMSREQANQIANFINKYDNIDNIIIHCDAGISRSSGIGAAILKVKNGDDWEIFNNPKFCPNMNCYRKMFNAFHQDIDLDEINEKITKNISLWIKKNLN